MRNGSSASRGYPEAESPHLRIIVGWFFARSESIFRQFCRFFVTDQRIKAGNHRQALFHRGFACLRIGFQSVHAELDKRIDSVGHQVNAFQHRVAHDGHHDVELKVTASGSADRNGLIVADDARCHLHQAFAHDRIDFPRHDRAAGLAIGQDDFEETAARSRPEPTYVVGYIHKRGGNRLQLTVTINQAIALRVGFEVIDRFDKGYARAFRQRSGDSRPKLWMRIDTTSHSSTADRQLQYRLQRHLGPTNRKFDLARKPAELLAESQWWASIKWCARS